MEQLSTTSSRANRRGKPAQNLNTPPRRVEMKVQEIYLGGVLALEVNGVRRFGDACVPTIGRHLLHPKARDFTYVAEQMRKHLLATAGGSELAFGTEEWEKLTEWLGASRAHQIFGEPSPEEDGVMIVHIPRADI